MNLDNILCIQNTRTVNKDNTISYNNLILQIPKDIYRYSYQKTKVKVYEYADVSMGIFYGHRCLGYYHKDGGLNETKLKANKTDATTAIG